MQPKSSSRRSSTSSLLYEDHELQSQNQERKDDPTKVKTSQRTEEDIYIDVMRQANEAIREMEKPHVSQVTQVTRGKPQWTRGKIRTNRMALYLREEDSEIPQNKLLERIAMGTIHFKARWHYKEITKKDIQQMIKDFQPEPELFEWEFMPIEILGKVIEGPVRRSEAQVIAEAQAHERQRPHEGYYGQYIR